MIHHGDCIEVMAAMESESVDAIVTDPPYSLSFMGKTWDRDHDHRPWAEAAYRVAKPSAYLLAFGGTRTVHRMTVALEDAGWIIRDMLVWAYASGFPKSKASLKPAWEPIVMARKPGPLRELAIDACRIGTTKDVPASPSQMEDVRTHGKFGPTPTDTEGWNRDSGRWPANVILTDPIFETYSRFFLVPKADRADREPVLGGLEPKACANVHPTVKPTELMRHLVRLVTPSGGLVLDPFLGSGTTALACELEGSSWIGIEREAEYVAIAEARLNGTQRGIGLVV